MDWRATRDYRIWRAQVIRRDKECQICGGNKSRQAHHMNSGSYFPSDRYDIENGITLCKSCHTNYHTNYHKSFREKCTRYDFKNFQSLLEKLGRVMILKKLPKNKTPQIGA